MSMLAVRSAYWPYVRGLLSPASMLPATRRRSSAWLLQDRRNLRLTSARISTERGHRSGRRGALGGLVAVLLALTVAGCSSDSDAEPTASPTIPATAAPTPTTSPTASPSPVDEDAEAALEVYREFWAAVTEARSIPDATLPALSRYASGTALTNEQEFLLALEREGVAYEGEPKLSVVAPVAPGPVTVQFDIANPLKDAAQFTVRIAPAEDPAALAGADQVVGEPSTDFAMIMSVDGHTSERVMELDVELEAGETKTMEAEITILDQAPNSFFALEFSLIHEEQMMGGLGAVILSPQPSHG